MRLFQLGLVLLETVALVQAAPTTQHLPVHERDLDVTGLLLPRLDPRGRVRWTFDKSCNKNDKQREAIRKAVEEVAARSKLVVSKLREWKILPDTDDKRKQIQRLLGTEDFEARVDQAIKMFDAVSKIEGPIGKDQNKFSAHADWAALKNDDHWLNFVIYCGPDLGEQTLPSDPKKKGLYDKAQQRFIMETDETDQALLEMKRDIDAGTFVGDSWPEAVVTRSGRDPNNAEPNDITPAKSRRVIPTAVTLHPVWLEWTFGGDDDYKTAVPTMESIAKAVRKPDGKTSLFIDEVTGLVGTLHHELFHTPGLGALFDTDGDDSYEWGNMLKNKNMNLPEFYMFLAMLVGLTDQGIKVADDGTLSA